tara:strand:- start:367 stop:558 length:192 start_codon:yes stop_codon:yes gene_type:complete
MLTESNVDYGTSEVNLRYNNFLIIRESDHMVCWKNRDSGEVLATMSEKDGTINFKRLWNSTKG